MSEDQIRDEQINKYLEEQEMMQEVSSCCGEHIILGDVCSDCKEHCEPIELGEWLYIKEEEARCDQASADKELKEMK